MKSMNNYNPKYFLRSIGEIKGFLTENPRTKIALISFVLFGTVYVVSKMSEDQKIVYKDHRKPVFSKGRILGAQAASYLKSKEAMLSKTARKIMAKNKSLEERLKLLEKRIDVKS
ncbi:MAG: hypothetical protein HON90_07105 [Halobacteriovoraceae bacterium]|jgi:hypothetical protein|nr:hypothetical protein [Halobacteriovoraceae bacterium]